MSRWAPKASWDSCGHNLPLQQAGPGPEWPDRPQRDHLERLLLIDDFQITSAGIAGFGAHASVAAVYVAVGNAIAVAAGGAGDPHQIPFSVAQCAVQVAQPGHFASDAHDAGHGRKATAGADARLSSRGATFVRSSLAARAVQCTCRAAATKGRIPRPDRQDRHAGPDRRRTPGPCHPWSEVVPGYPGRVEAHEARVHAPELSGPASRKDRAAGMRSASGRQAMLSGGCQGCFPRKRKGRIFLQQFVLGPGQTAEKGEPVGKGMAFCQGGEPRGPIEKDTGGIGKDHRRGSPHRQNGIMRSPSWLMGQPPVIWRYQVSWCCFAQARLTVPYTMARIVPLVQIARIDMARK